MTLINPSDSRKFKRHNQIVLEGNNKVGNKGKLRCIECRKVHSKVKSLFPLHLTCQCVRPEGSDACEYCQLRGRQCIMTWGAKKEVLLALSGKHTCGDVSRQLPTADDTLVSEDERWRLQWAVCNLDWISWRGLLTKIMAVYGVTISHPSLRLAVLASVDLASPYEKQTENFVLRSIAAGSQIPASDLDEADLIATSLLAVETYWLRYGGRRLQHKLPSCSIHVKRFCELMKKLAPEGKQSISRCAFGRHWLAFLGLVNSRAPFYYDDPSSWELLLLASRLFDLHDFATWTDAFTLYDANHLDVSTLAWINAIWLHCRVIWKTLFPLLEHDFDESLPKNELQKTILGNSLLALSTIDSWPFHQQIVCTLNHTGINKFSHIKTQTNGNVRALSLWEALRDFYASCLLVTLILGADNISKSAKLDEAAFHASRLTLEVSQYYDPRVATKWWTSARNIMFVAVASIVYPVSQVAQGGLFPLDLSVNFVSKKCHRECSFVCAPLGWRNGAEVLVGPRSTFGGDAGDGEINLENDMATYLWMGRVIRPARRSILEWRITCCLVTVT